MALPVTLEFGPEPVLTKVFGDIVLVAVEGYHDDGAVEGLGHESDQQEYCGNLSKHRVFDAMLCKISSSCNTIAFLIDQERIFYF